MVRLRKFNRYERAEIKEKVLAQVLHGEGMYLFRNHSRSELTLPRPTKSGLRTIPPMGEFQGDSYYMQMVRTGMLRLVKTLQAPESKNLTESVQEENKMDKLILDQPDTVTAHGKVEHVVPQTPQRLQETTGAKKEDVLLTEEPLGGSFEIIE